MDYCKAFQKGTGKQCFEVAQKFEKFGYRSSTTIDRRQFVPPLLLLPNKLLCSFCFSRSFEAKSFGFFCISSQQQRSQRKTDNSLYISTAAPQKVTTVVVMSSFEKDHFLFIYDLCAIGTCSFSSSSFFYCLMHFIKSSNNFLGFPHFLEPSEAARPEASRLLHCLIFFEHFPPKI